MKTVFILLTNESWNLIMYDHIRAAGTWYCLFFVAVVIFGNYVILKLFIAILIYNFADASLKQEIKTINESTNQTTLSSHILTTFWLADFTEKI